MISKTVTQTQRFLQMPLESQALYFHLIQNSDDDGIVEAFPIVRMVGANEDSLKLLQAKNFIKPLNSEMVYFITDFHEQNSIQSHHYKKSIYQDLLLLEDKLKNPRIKSNIPDKFDDSDIGSQNVNNMLSESYPNISQINSNKSNVVKDNVGESKTTSKQQEEIYIDNFDATSEIKNIPKSIEDYLGQDYITKLSDSDFITGLTKYSFNRQADPYEINTLKKRLKDIDRELLQDAYRQASLNGANSLGYITATLNNWEKEGIKNHVDWLEHETRRESREEIDSPF